MLKPFPSSFISKSPNCFLELLAANNFTEGSLFGALLRAGLFNNSFFLQLMPNFF